MLLVHCLRYFFCYIRYMKNERAKKIVVTSGKGGVGKTTLTANLGIALAMSGKRVALVDVDFGLNNLDVVMGLENKVLFDISDVLEGRCRVKQALIQHPRFKNLSILPSDSLHSDASVGGQNLKLVLEGIVFLFDYILIDCPAGIDLGFHRAVSVADSAIVVTTPSIPSLRDADKVINILKSYKLESIGIVVNRARGDLIMSEKMMYPNDICSVLKAELLGVLPEEDAVFLSSGASLPVRCDSYKAYKLLANNVIKGTKRLFDVTGKYSGFFGSIRRSIKRSV